MAFFASGISLLVSDPAVEPAYLRSFFAGGLLGLAALGLSLIGTRRASSLLLATGLILITTWQILAYQLPYEIGLAAFVGVLLVTIVGTGQSEVLLATAAAVLAGVYTYLDLHAGSPSFQGLLTIGGLLTATGITLSWLQDNLLRAIGQLELSSARLLRLSHQDPLTGLGNRRLFDDEVDRKLAFISAQRPLALVLIDVDNLKSINDRHGHPAGDQALMAVADAIRASTRESDSAARWGGDEFGILLGTGGIVGARRVAQRIHQHLTEWSSKGIRLSVSIGIAEATDPDSDVQELLHSADSDMYAGRRHLLAGSLSSD